MNRSDAVEFPKDGDGCRWYSTPHDPVTRVRSQGMGHVKVNQHRAVVGEVKTVGVRRAGGRWVVVVTAGQEWPGPLTSTSSAMGIDLGQPTSSPTRAAGSSSTPATA